MYKAIEKARKRHLIAVYLGARDGLAAQMAQDMLTPMFRQLELLPADGAGVDIPSVPTSRETALSGSLCTDGRRMVRRKCPSLPRF